MSVGVDEFIPENQAAKHSVGDFYPFVCGESRPTLVLSSTTRLAQHLQWRKGLSLRLSSFGATVPLSQSTDQTQIP